MSTLVTRCRVFPKRNVPLIRLASHPGIGESPCGGLGDGAPHDRALLARLRYGVMCSSRQHWQGVAGDCARSLARDDEPVSFLLGAGASLSSGAPTTTSVVDALARATAGRLRAKDVRTFVDRIGERDKQNILRGLFAEVRPHIGYLSLAAIGRHRRVVVANLNWDPLVAEACAQLGVPCRSFDLADRQHWQLVNDLPADSGVVVIHIHGLLGYRSRIASLETLSFTPEEERLLAELVWANPTVIIGASLVDDTDLEAMFRRLGMKDDHAAARWLFARHGGTLPLPRTSMAAEHLSQWPLNCVASQYADFDELMLTILAEQVGFTYENLRMLRPTANLPTKENLIFPSPELIRDRLDSRTVVVSGEPRLGKTTLSYLMAWWRVLWDHPRGSEPATAHDALGGFEDVATTLAALSTQGDDPTAGAATAGKSVLVLDDPYGQDSNASNPLFLTQLRRVARLPDGPTIIVATRELGWQIALRAEDITERDLSVNGITTISPEVKNWWTTDALIAMTANLPNGGELLDAVSAGYLNTPGRVLDRSWVNSVRRAARVPDTLELEIAADKEKLIALVPLLARGSALARLQEFCYEPLEENEFEEILGTSIKAVPGLKEMLVRYDFEGRPRVRLAHPTYREAIDSYLADPANMDSITSWLTAQPLANQLLLGPARAYRFVNSVIAQPDGWADRPMPADVSEWAPQLLAASQSEATVNALRSMRWDLWTATELAYELIRLYPVIRNIGGREFIHDMLHNDGATGAYAVLEACLYLRSSASDEVWTALKGRLYDLTAKAGNSTGQHTDMPASRREVELALVIDGLLWRPPPLDTFSQQFVREFLRAAFDEVAVSEPLWSVLRFAAGYHPGGLVALRVDDLVEADQDVPLTDEQIEFITWLVKWHFVHQSRARAILARQPYVDQDFLCRSLHAAPVDADSRGLRRLMGCLLALPSTAGWVMHLGCNLLSIGVAVDDSCRSLMRRSVTAARDQDPGIITCALTYAATAQFSDVLRPYFARPQNRDALLDAAFEGPVINGIRIHPPRFVCVRPPGMIQADLKFQWPRLHEAGLLTNDPERVAHDLRNRAEVLASSGQVDGKAVDRLLDRVQRGDFRILEQAVSGYKASDNILDYLLRQGTVALDS